MPDLEGKAVDPEIVQNDKISKKIVRLHDERGRFAVGNPGHGRPKGALNKITREQQKMQVTLYKAINSRSDEIIKMPIDKLLAAGVQLTPKDSKLIVDMNHEERIAFIFPQMKQPNNKVIDV
jgi:hypothetical protein